MKKAICIAGLFVAIQFTVTAQSNFVTATVDNTSAIGNINYLNNFSIINPHYFLSDSASLVKDHAYYLQKSKKQRTTGFVLLGAGVIITGIGLLVADNTNYEITNLIIAMGAVCGAFSIAHMTKSKKNKIKAKLILSNQKTGFGIPRKYGKELSGVTLSIPIGR